MDFSKIKQTLAAAGANVSSGTGMTTEDMQQYVAYANLKYGISLEQAAYGLAYQGLLPVGLATDLGLVEDTEPEDEEPTDPEEGGEPDPELPPEGGEPDPELPPEGGEPPVEEPTEP